MHEMSRIGDRLQRHLGAVEGAAAGRGARSQRLAGTPLAEFVSINANLNLKL